MNIRIEKLHAAARQYCSTKHQYWMEEYNKLIQTGQYRDGNTYTSDALNVYTRYIVLNAILIEIEKFTPLDFSTLEEAKELLCLSADLAENIFTKAQNKPIAIKAIREERSEYIHFIQTLSEEDLDEVEPMLFRRVINKSEKQQIWAQLKKVWNIQGSVWYPLSGKNPGDLIAFQDIYFSKEVGVQMLRTLLTKYGITRVWELREYGPEYEMEVRVFNPSYNGAEGYWCSHDMNWIIYASHEGSVTIGGWLLDDVKEVWPNWEERIWTKPFFE